MWDRDPLSVLLDPGARQFLGRVYAAKGGWVTTRLADPDARTAAYAEQAGTPAAGRDNASTVSGRHMNARSRWGRAFVRSMYYNHRWYGAAQRRGGPALRGTRRLQPYGRPLEIEIGRHVPARGVIPPGRLVRARLRPGGKTARAAVQRMDLSARIYDDDGRPVARWSDPTRRDW